MNSSDISNERSITRGRREYETSRVKRALRRHIMYTHFICFQPPISRRGAHNIVVSRFPDKRSRCKVDTMEDMRKYEKVKDPSKEKQNEAAVKESSPLGSSTRSFQQHLPSSQGVSDAQQAQGTMFSEIWEAENKLVRQLARTKIGEALQTMTTPTKQFSNSPTLKRELNHDKKKSYNVKPSQHSRKINPATIGGSVSKSEKKKCSRTEPHKLHFSELNNADETRKVTDSSKKEDHMESSSGLKNGVGGLRGFSFKNGPSDAGPPEIVTQDPECSSRQTERCRTSEGADATIFNPSSTPPQVFGNFNGVPSELNEEEYLARAVSSFATVLERLKINIKSEAKEKSAEILTNNAMEMQSKLQYTESWIQEDVRKLTGIGEKKRRDLETILQEQNGELDDIYERFRKDVDAHFQKCKNTLEGLELQQTAFKALVEKQNASHGNLLIQVEEAINTKLSDVQKRMNVQKSLARENMLKLKSEIAEWLEEDPSTNVKPTVLEQDGELEMLPKDSEEP